MKIVVWLIILYAATTLGAPCGPDGDSTKPKIIALDQLKNRDTVPTSVEPMNWDVLTEQGDDSQRYDSAKGATLTGYVAFVEPGGIESCNCHAKDAAHRDTHIYVAQDAQHAQKKQCVVVEVTPRSRANHPEWATAVLKKTIVGHTVQFSGWIFYDEEHKQNATDTSPQNAKAWRVGCVEIHPVTGIKVIK